MIISNTHRAIFIHIPKTAGTSISNLLDPTLRWNDVILGGTDFGERIQPAYAARFGLSKHMRARDVRRVIGEEAWDSYFSFAIVRHPYARFVSFYNWKRGAVARAQPDSPVWKWPATEAFQQSRSVSEFMRHEKFLTSRAAEPQVDWVDDESGRRIVGYVGRFEELSEAIRTIGPRFGLDPRALGRHNASESEQAPGETLASEDDYRFLHEFYRRDFEAFGYDPTLRL